MQKKILLHRLEVQSFITSVEAKSLEEIKGGQQTLVCTPSREGCTGNFPSYNRRCEITILTYPCSAQC